MPVLLLFSTLVISQAGGEQKARAPIDRVAGILERASRESDLDGAGLVLSSLLSDESKLRSAYLIPIRLDERSMYVLFGRQWGARATVTWKARQNSHRILVQTVSTKPILIRSAIRADRYDTYLRKRGPGGAATINYFPFFSYSKYADDLAEQFFETLRKETARPAEPILSPYNELRGKGSPPQVLLTAEEMEVNLLDIWQMLCGVCDRLHLIDKATTENWRGRFPELDRWFKEHRPYIVWDNKESHCRIDEEAKELSRPTPRASRLIPELKPPWVRGGDGIRRD
jgi:hypothetical protein